MKTFQIEIKETLVRVITVEASSAEEAFDMVNEKYRNEELFWTIQTYTKQRF